ncbi:E3 ubiquitin-protein ligase SH3RF3-like [Clarias gariepinus]|uniref:E3 ubiquitin-protein ligase SH3RF3-like n=1 Tax=Clarias gariepinus TaxID=13013 RepID=UPI00234DED78|nr:E3 ubiquitin-protein ligase SH3RF3-like [Clarias gariepinus]
MDECALLDLLECSVCLERLDASARVLPCQHTFCRRCLENIVSSRRELRCPECRVLVDCGVGELPANILLVRLLDGLKHRGTASPPNTTGTGTNTGTGTGTALLRDSPSATRSSPVQNVPQLPCGKALYTYEGKEPGDLKFNKGDIIILRRKVDENWFHGELNGSHGFLPASYVQCIRPLSQTPPQGKALYDFEMKDKEQDKDCLSFTKDEILTVIRRVDENWAEGMLGDKIGIFPILYVELNEAAKQLMEMDKPAPGPSADSETPASCLGEGHGDAPRQRAEGKKNAKKRHSFTALSVTQRTALANNNRHSMEINASDPRARVGEYAHLSSSAPTSQDSSFNAGAAVQPRVTPTSGELLAAAKVQLPLNIYLALYAYKPQKADELELRKGEMYRVTEKCQDGWFKGTSLRSGASGVFPGNYVTPVSRAPFAVGQSRGCIPGSVIKPVPGSPGSPRPSSPVLISPASRAVPHMTTNPVPSLVTSPASSLVTSPAPSLSSSPASSPHLKNCLRMCGQPQLGGSPYSSPSRSPTPLSTRPPMISSPQVHPVSSLNLGVAHPNGASPPECPSSPKMEDKKAEKKEKKSGVLLKLLKKKSRSPPSSSPTHDPTSSSTSASSSSSTSSTSSAAVHGATAADFQAFSRAGSCPIESDMQGAAGIEPLNRKCGSLDLDLAPRQPFFSPTSSSSSSTSCSAMLAIRPEPKPLSRERYRAVVPYPPQSDAEIELKQGDIVFVHKKRDDGWYKGTLQRTGRTGLFPGSFVESF